MAGLLGTLQRTGPPSVRWAPQGAHHLIILAKGLIVVAYALATENGAPQLR